jgi:hypothetical protein
MQQRFVREDDPSLMARPRTTDDEHDPEPDPFEGIDEVSPELVEWAEALWANRDK